MTEVAVEERGITAQLIRDFIATYDRNDPTDRWIAARLVEKLNGELYYRERTYYAPWIDVGGEG
jgi:hypothetical protein